MKILTIVMGFLMIICLSFGRRIKATSKKVTPEDYNILYLSDIHMDLLYTSDKSLDMKDVCRSKIEDVNLVVLARQHGIGKNQINQMLIDYSLSENDFPQVDDKTTLAHQFDYGRYSCNPPSNLFKTALDKASKNEYKYIILGGDIIPHKTNAEIAIEIAKPEKDIKILAKLKMLHDLTFKVARKMIDDAFKKTAKPPVILATVGNNDFYEKNFIPNKDSRESQINRYKELITISPVRMNIKFGETMDKGFYYSYSDAENNVKFIILNSNYFSDGVPPKQDDDIPINEAEDQIKFLTEELDNMKELQKAFVIMHMPTYADYMISKFAPPIKAIYARKIERLASKYQNKIEMFFFGHIHIFKLGITKDNTMPAVSFPGLTPYRGSNPGFGIIKIKDKRLNDITIINADLIKTLQKSKSSEIVSDKVLDSFDPRFDVDTNDIEVKSKKTEVPLDNLWPYETSLKNVLGFKDFTVNEMGRVVKNIALVEGSTLWEKFSNIVVGAPFDDKTGIAQKWFKIRLRALTTDHIEEKDLPNQINFRRSLTLLTGDPKLVNLKDEVDKIFKGQADSLPLFIKNISK